MYCFGNLTRGAADVIDPHHREINFEDGEAQVIVVDSLRYAWVRSAPANDDLGQFIKDNYQTKIAIDEEREKLPETINLELDSQWKQNIYDMYGSLFVDISDFLQDVNGRTGHYHGHNVSKFAMTSHTTQKTFKENVYLVPAFIAQDCTIGVSMTNEEGEKIEIGTFSMARRHTALWLKRGLKIDFEIVEHGRKLEDGALAAVLVYGGLCINGTGVPQTDQTKGELPN